MSTQFTVAAALSAMRGRRAVLIGDLVLDSYIYGEAMRVSREAPVLVVRKERAEHRLGGAANTAANLAALGLATKVLGVVGEQSGTADLQRLLAASGADISHLRQGAVTLPIKTRVLAGAFGTSRQQVLRIDEEPAGPLPAELLARLAADVREHGASADVVVVSDYGYGLAAPPLLAAVQDLVRKGVPVCVDSRYQLPLFTGVTAVTPNVPEAEGVAGLTISDQASVERAGVAIRARLGCEVCLLTQGRAGMTLFRAGASSAHVDIVGEDEVADVTGAGDTVLATFGGALAAGIGMENGMRLANLAAGIVVTRLGTATASPAEIIDSAARHGVELLPWGK